MSGTLIEHHVQTVLAAVATVISAVLIALVLWLGNEVQTTSKTVAIIDAKLKDNRDLYYLSQRIDAHDRMIEGQGKRIRELERAVR